MDGSKSVTGHDNCIRPGTLTNILFAEGFADLDPHFSRFCLIEDKHIHFVIEQLAGVANIDSSFDFITGEYPQLNASFFDVWDGRTHLILKFILDSCGTYQIKLDF